MTTTPTPPKTTAKTARELLRFGLGAAPMPLTRLEALLGVAAPSEHATIRIYNGSAIIEEPPADEEEHEV